MNLLEIKIVIISTSKFFFLHKTNQLTFFKFIEKRILYCINTYFSKTVVTKFLFNAANLFAQILLLNTHR